MKICSKCKNSKTEACFSPYNWNEKDSKRRCKDCVKETNFKRRWKGRTPPIKEILEVGFKRCPGCDTVKEHKEFTASILKNGGSCKKCNNSRQQEKRKENKESNQARDKNYKKKSYKKNKAKHSKKSKENYQKNKETIIINVKNYYINNKDKILKRNKKKYEENKEIILAQQKVYYNENKELILEKNRNKTPEQKTNIILKRNKNYIKRYKTDPNFKLKRSVSRAVNKAIFKNGKSILKYLPYTMQELKQHLENQFVGENSWMTWENWGGYRVDSWDDNNSSTWVWNIDHIIPHSSFNYTSMDDQEFRDCWALVNLRPYSAKQNILDGDRR